MAYQEIEGTVYDPLRAEAAVLAALKGEPGEKGEQGEPGAPGSDAQCNTLDYLFIHPAAFEARKTNGAE